MLDVEQLKKYLDAGFNVLMEGTHGLGKTFVISQVFNEKGLKWKYFSAPTMDPWIDLIGVPKTVVNSDGKEELILVRPREFANDEIEAIFFDEFNRAPSKVIDAVMELIQFHSINGVPFKNLKAIWASINPYDEDGTYSVSQLDPAVRDRFHIQLQIPLALNIAYLTSTFGSISQPFIKWWKELPTELRIKVPPRRLDYAIQGYNLNFDLRHILPSETNVKKLEEYIASSKKGSELSELLNKSEAELKSFFDFEKTVRYALEILNTPKLAKLVCYFPQDFIESHIQTNNHARLHSLFIQHALKHPDFYTELSHASKQILSKSKKENGIIEMAQIDFDLERSIEVATRQAVGKSISHIAKNLEPVFQSYCEKIKEAKSSDVVSFFNIVFSTKDLKGKVVLEPLLSGFLKSKTLSSYASLSIPQQYFVGLFLNFSFKHAKKNKLDDHCASIMALVEKLRQAHSNSSSRFDKSYLSTLCSFSEHNWPELKIYLAKQGSFSKAERSQVLIQLAKKTSGRMVRSGFTHKEPSNLEHALGLFNKRELAP